MRDTKKRHQVGWQAPVLEACTLESSGSAVCPPHSLVAAACQIGYRLASCHLRAGRPVEAASVAAAVLSVHPEHVAIRRDVLAAARLALKP